MKVLIVGFERWGSYSTNPSQYVAEKLDGKKIAGAKIKGVVLPVNFKTLPKTLHHAIKKYRPDILITLGLAFRNMDKITLETVAKRKIKPFFPDNYGRWPNGTNKPRLYDVIGKEKGPFFRKSKLPLKNIISKLKKANIPLSVSQKQEGTCASRFFILGNILWKKKN
ncbi:hypothetical protein HYT23_01335 [Candidatus Pacearchaeota archaeon]|nr:hypothetical protein [Candidatus Pacearchaeota archaeon]